MGTNKNTKLREWALAAEVIGGLAVVISLIFLVIETRENTNAIQAQTYQSLTADLNSVRRDLGDPEIAALRLKLQDNGRGALDELERYRIINALQGLWGVYESAYYARERGILGENEWDRFESAVCRIKERDSEAWIAEGYNVGIAMNITLNFRNYVESLCD